MSQTDTPNAQERHQKAYHHLSGLLTEAEDALSLEPENEDELREALRAGEDLLMDLDDVEHRLITELANAEEDILGASK